MKFSAFIFVLFTSLFTISQEKFSKEISLITDNDLYISPSKDRYYTSGIFVTYRYLSLKKSTSLKKRILEFKLGQEMYTPHLSVVPTILEHDRPFAGYLYGIFAINRIYRNEQIFNTSLQLGVVGSNSYAKEVQELIHDVYGFRKSVGWQYQIKNALALNVNAAYFKTILKTKKNYFDIIWANNVNVGTIYTNISTGFNARIGFNPLQKIDNSIAYKTNLNNANTTSSNAIESFLFIKPMLRYALYDATLQGSFLNKTSLVTKELYPLVFNVELGVKFTYKRLNFRYSYHYHTSKSKELRYTSGNVYGRIGISYLVH